LKFIFENEVQRAGCENEVQRAGCLSGTSEVGDVGPQGMGNKVENRIGI
jgi:hypothetical protein